MDKIKKNFMLSFPRRRESRNMDPRFHGDDSLVKKKIYIIFVGLLLVFIVSGFLIFRKGLINQTPTISKSLTFQRQLIGNNQYVGKIKGVMKTSFGQDKDGGRVTIDRNESKLEFGLPINNSTIIASSGNTFNPDQISFESDNKIIEVRYSLIDKGLKEEIILNRIPQENKLPISLKTENLKLKITPDGIPVFYDNNGQYQLHFERPFMKDGAGNVSYGVKYLFGNEKKVFGPQKKILLSSPSSINYDQSSIIIELDSAWLHDPKRVLPITIDPTVVHDTTSEFATGGFDRAKDTGSGSSPVLETYYQELSADEYTVGLWHMDETADDSCSGGQDACDVSGNTLHGTASAGSTITTTSQLLGAAARSFNGSSGYYTVPASAKLDIQRLTIESWVYSTNFNHSGFIFEKTTNGTVNTQYSCFFNNTDTLYFRTYNSASTQDDLTLTTSAFFRNSAWNHVACVYDGSQKIIYVNGTPAASKSYTQILQTNAAGTSIVGAYGTGQSYFFNGNIDEVRVSNIARSPEEIKASASRRPYSVYTSDVIDLTNVNSWNSFSWTETGVATGDGETLYSSSDLVAQWNFNETSGTTATNNAGSCGASCNGTLSGFDSTASQDADPDSSWTSNNRRWGAGALQFDGTDSYVNIPYNASWQTVGDFTIEGWFNTKNLTDYKTIFSDAGNVPSSYDGREIRIFSNSINYSTYNYGTNCSVNSQPISIGKWYHFVAIRSGTTNYLYLNGVLQGSSTGSCYAASGDAGNIGRYNVSGSAGGYFSGIIDSTRIYSRALSASEILSNYNAANVELQTRVGSSTAPNDGSWEAWRPTTGETAIDNLDTSSEQWAVSSSFKTSSTISKTSGVNSGDGADGVCTVSSSININTNSCTGSGTADAVIFSDVTLERAGESSVTVSSTPTGLSVGDEFLIINLQGTSTNYENVGKYETHTISSIDTNTLYFTDYPLLHTYDGTTQKIMVQRVPNYTNVTVDSTFTLTANAWDGTKGGVLFFRSSGTVTNNGTISMNENGYRGGSGGTNGGQGGEAFCSSGGTGSNSVGTPGGSGAGGGGGAGGSGGLNPTGNAGGVGYCGGGGGGGRGGNGGSGSSSLGGAGGGGGYKDNAATQLGAGGGGGYGSYGTNGGSYGSAAVTGGINTSGNGGYDGGGGGGGGTYGTPELSRLYFGSGGGAGGGWGGDGGNGGGIVYIAADTITNTNLINADGEDGTNGSTNYRGPGGGGAGGSILLSADTLTLGSSGVTTSYGARGTLYEQNSGWGGNGRIAIYYTSSLSGTTNPNAYASKFNPQIKLEGTGSTQITTNHTSVDSSTVGLWRLDETGGTGVYIQDASPNGLDGTPTGTTVVQGISGKARSFAGSASDYITVNHDDALNSSTLSISAWFKTNTTVNAITKWDGASDGYIFYPGSTNGFWCWIDGTWNSAVVKTTLNDGWHHGVCTYDGSNIRTYVDGALENTTAKVGATFTNTHNLIIGNYSFNGTIDELRISNVARTAEEIAEAYRAGRDHYLNKTISSTDLSGKTSLPFYVAADRPGTYLSAVVGESAFANYQPDANTVGLWHLSEQSGSGAYIKDSSGNSNHGTPTGTTFAQGKIGKGRYFDNSNDVVDLGSGTSFDFGNNGVFTHSGWINPTTLGDYDAFVSKVVAARNGTYSYMTVFMANGRLAVYSPSVNWVDVCPAGSAVAGTWQHVAFAYNGTNMYGYINGRLCGSTAFSYTDNAAHNLFIGSWYVTTQSYDFHGNIDEVTVSNTTRSADEIRQAYEIGLRSHPITIDFAASLDSDGLIADTDDLSFIVDATAYGLSSQGSNLYEGDKIIVRENYDGTEYIAQGTVTSVTASTGAVTIDAWDTGSTVPSGGFTANADVFKWQREYWHVSDNTLSSHMDDITNLTLHLTDGNEGRTIWLDDLKSAGDYLTTPGGSTITSSTGYKYFQYRIIQHSLDEAVSASLTSVTLDYDSNAVPNTPTLDLPTNTSTNQLLSPVLKTTATDSESDYLRYKIELCTNVDMTTGCQTFDQTVSQTGWSGQDTQTDTAYTSGTQAVYTIQTPLISASTYYWRSYAKDPAGSNTWSDTQGSPYSFTTSNPPTAPTVPYAEGASNPSRVFDATPEFSAIHNDPDSDAANYYEIEVNTASDFTGTVMWDTGTIGMSNLANGARSTDVSYAGTTLSFNGATYYWRIRFTDVKGATGAWSATQNFTMDQFPNTPTLDYPTTGTINVPVLTALKTTTTDNNGDYLRYKIEICTNELMTIGCNTYDQTSSQTGWSGQNTQSDTAYTSGTQATYTLQSALATNTDYYWRSYAKDPAGSNTWSSTQTTPYVFSTTPVVNPSAPTSLLTNGATNPTGVLTSVLPYFSAIHNDIDNQSANYYQIIVSLQPDVNGAIFWDSGQTAMSTTTNGARSPNITYAGIPLSLNGQVLYWKIRFWDTGGNVGEWSVPANFTVFSLTSTASCIAVKNNTNTQIIVSWIDQTSSEDGYYIEKKTDGSAFADLITKAADSVSHTDSSVSSGHSYQYRIRATNGSDYSDWCTTNTLNLAIGNFKLDGLQLNGLQLY